MCQCPSHFGRFECTNCIRLKWRINSIVNNSQFYYLHAILIKFANDTDKCQNRIHKQHEKWHAPITIVLLCAFVPIQFSMRSANVVPVPKFIDMHTYCVHSKWLLFDCCIVQVFWILCHFR